MENSVQHYKLGWLPDYPSISDYTSEQKEVSLKLTRFGQTDSIKTMLKKAGVSDTKKLKVPATVDLSPWCPPIENQGSIGSCTANAGVGIVEYFEKRAFGKHIDASRLFLYKTTRNLLHWTGDTGAFLRSTMGAMVLFGVPPEEYWPYVATDFDKEPSAFCYSFAQNYQAMTYFRYDPAGTQKPVLLTNIKAYLAAGLPSMFGFTVYNSYSQAASTGKIPFPTSGEQVVGGHAVIAVGYDDAMKIKNTNTGAAETKGAVLFRNSWGSGWGNAGYGWLPYDYILKGLATDWWTVLKNEWIDTGAFKA